MAIKANDVLQIGDPTEYKLHLACRNPEGHHPLDAYLTNRSLWLGWNRWKGARNDWNRRYIFSLIEFTPQPDSWLFGGVFEVLGFDKDGYKLGEVERFANYEGRLLLSFHRYQGMLGRAFCLESFLDQFEVSEIRADVYSGETFCGYHRINHDFAVLESIFAKEKADWRGALSSMKGVYLICDKLNGKKYIGSACGEGGIWGRWADYMGTGHGGNDELVRLIRIKGKDYARTNFKFSLLEIMGMTTPNEVIGERESFWKESLMTRRHGYNKN